MADDTVSFNMSEFFARARQGVGPARILSNEEMAERQRFASRLARHVEDSKPGSKLQVELKAAREQLDSDAYKPLRDAIAEAAATVKMEERKVADAEFAVRRARQELLHARDLHDSAIHNFDVATKEVGARIAEIERRQKELAHERVNCLTSWKHRLVKYSRWQHVIDTLEESLREIRRDESLFKEGMIDNILDTKLHELRQSLTSISKANQTEENRARKKDIEATIFRYENRLEKYYRDKARIETELSAVIERAVAESIEEAGIVEAAMVSLNNNAD